MKKNNSKEKRGIKMDKEKFGSVILDGKMIDLDRENIENLEQVEAKLQEREKDLKNKIFTVFKQ